MIFAKLIQGLRQPTKRRSTQGLKILLALVFTGEKCSGMLKKTFKVSETLKV